jgi:hypothetical protein
MHEYSSYLKNNGRKNAGGRQGCRENIKWFLVLYNLPMKLWRDNGY